MHQRHRTAMKQLITASLLALVLSGCATSCPKPTPDAAEKSSFRVTETNGNYEVTVPKSRLLLRFPKGDLTFFEHISRTATQSTRLFYLADDKTQFRVSGWLEPAYRYPGIEKYWVSIRNHWPKQIPPPEDISFSKEGIWEIVWYSVPVREEGLSVLQRNIHASCVKAGTWIDWHISVFGYDEARKDEFVKFLRSVQVERKP